MNATVCPGCQDERKQLADLRDLYGRMRLAMGAGPATRALESRVNALEVKLFRHRCVVAAD